MQKGFPLLNKGPKDAYVSFISGFASSYNFGLVEGYKKDEISMQCLILSIIVKELCS